LWIKKIMTKLEGSLTLASCHKRKNNDLHH
jgi:hypothetical protein